MPPAPACRPPRGRGAGPVSREGRLRRLPFLVERGEPGEHATQQRPCVAEAQRLDGSSAERFAVEEILDHDEPIRGGRHLTAVRDRVFDIEVDDALRPLLAHVDLPVPAAELEPAPEDDPTEALAFATASLELADTADARLFALRALQEAPPAWEVEKNTGST